MKIPLLRKQMYYSAILCAELTGLFILLSLCGAFFVSAAEVVPEANNSQVSVSLISETSSLGSPSIKTTTKMTEQEIEANRLSFILSSLYGTELGISDTLILKSTAEKTTRAQKNIFKKFKPDIDLLIANKVKDRKDNSKLTSRNEFESLRKINDDIAEETQKLDPQLEASYLMTLQDVYIPNDPLMNEQWYISYILETTKGLWFVPTNTHAKPIVAVIDAGVDFTHEDLQSSKWVSSTCVNERGENIATCVGGFDFVDNDSDPYPSDKSSHGTAVASLIAAQTDNETGMASLSRGNVSIMSLRVANYGVLETDNIVKAILFAVHNGAQVINMSFAGPTYSEKLNQAILYAQDHGVVMVAAAGNAGLNLDNTPVYPASFNRPFLFTVGATDETGSITAWSNYGSALDVFSPGNHILSAVDNNSYSMMSGTSFSAPIFTSYLISKIEQGVSARDALQQLPTSSKLKKVSKKGYVLGSGRFALGQKQPTSGVQTALQKDASGRWFNPQSKAGEYVDDPSKFTLQAVNYNIALPVMISPGNTSQPGPSVSASTGSVTFKWNASSGAYSYGVYVRDIAANTLLVDCEKCTLSTSKSFSGFVAGKQYRWNMNAFDSAGNVSSAFTSPFYFTIAVPLLSAPGSITPGSTSASGPTLSGTSQTLSWGSVSGAAGYYVEFTNITTGAVKTYSTAYRTQSVPTPAGQKFKWRVRTVNSAAQMGSYSSYYYFQTPAPQNTAPATPSVSGSGSVVVNAGYVIGFAAVDSENDQIKFEVRWNAGASTAYSTYGYYTAGVSSGSATYTYTSSGTYCIQVRAIDILGNASAYSPCHNVVVATATVAPTLAISPTTQAVTSGTNATISLTTTNVSSCTISGNGLSNSPLSTVNGTFSVGPNTVAVTYTVNCLGTNGTTVSKSFNVTISTTATPKITFGAIPNVSNGTSFSTTLTASNIPSGAVITLTPSMGNITPSSITLSGTAYTGSFVIKSATNGITISAKYNGSTVGTSNTFTVTNGSTCTASLSQQSGVFVTDGTIPNPSTTTLISADGGKIVLNDESTLLGLCAPENPNLGEPYLITPGTQTSPGTQYSTSTLSFQITPVTGAASYEMYLRDIQTNSLYTFPMTSTSIKITGLSAGKSWRWNAAAKGSDGKLGWVTDVNYFTTVAGSPSSPTFTLTPSTQTIASGGTASLLLATTYVSSCTLSGGSFSNYSWGTMVNGTLNINNISSSVTYSIACLGQNGTTLTRTANVVVSATAPKVTFSTIGSQITGTVFPVTITASNIPSGSTISLSSSMGTIYPNSVTLSGTTWSGNIYITSATGNINIKARYNSVIVGTSNTFAISSPASCLAELELQGLCVPPSPTTPPPPNLAPGTVTSPGPEVTSISQTFTWSPVSGTTRYAFYLRDLDTGDLIISTENVQTNSYTYNYLGSGKKYRWNVVAFDSTGKGGWSADPMYFTVKAGLTQPVRVMSSLTQDELSLCFEGQSCTRYTYTAIVVDSGTSLQELNTANSAFTEGVEDEIYVSLGSIAIGTAGVLTAKSAVAFVTPIIENKLGKKAALYFGAKFIPGVGIVLIGVSTAAIAIDTADIAGKCFTSSGNTSIDPDFQFERTNWYYCGRLTVRSTFIALGGAYVKISGAKATGYLEAKTIYSQIDNVTLSVRATEVYNDPNRTVPITILKEVIKIFNRLPDPQLSSAYMYYSKVYINGKNYNLEVLYDTFSNQIWHFKYTVDAIGNLPAI